MNERGVMARLPASGKVGVLLFRERAVDVRRAIWVQDWGAGSQCVTSRAEAGAQIGSMAERASPRSKGTGASIALHAPSRQI